MHILEICAWTALVGGIVSPILTWWDWSSQDKRVRPFGFPTKISTTWAKGVIIAEFAFLEILAAFLFWVSSS